MKGKKRVRGGKGERVTGRDDKWKGENIEKKKGKCEMDEFESIYTRI